MVVLRYHFDNQLRSDFSWLIRSDNVGKLFFCNLHGNGDMNQIVISKELIERPQYDAPKFTLNPDKHDFYEFTKDDVSVENYITGEQITDIPIAI